MTEKSYYRLLQVDPAAETDVIQAAHRVLAARLHPELDFTGIDEYRLKELDRALAVLTDAEKRRAYDEELAADADRATGRVPVGPGYGRQRGYTLAERLHDTDVGALGELRLDFGRYAGRTLGELVASDPDYLRWLSRHSSGIRFRGAILRLLAERDAQFHPIRTSFTP
jgi:curved DNA-binding protein CbpA